MNLFCCPVCGRRMVRKEKTLRCSAGHSYDLAREGYAYLLPPNRKHSKDPGDDKEMVTARSAFLEKGYYLPLRTLLEQEAVTRTEGIDAPVVIDSGCGEGWYTVGIWRALQQAGRTPEVAGVDISRFSLRRAARRIPEGQFAVASSYRCAHLLFNIFSPLALSEFARVLRPGGFFVYVVPSARHLWQMKKILYPEPYENPVKVEEYAGFSYVGMKSVRDTIHLENSEDIMALFRMTPYAWKTPKAGIARLQACAQLETEIGFDAHIYQRAMN